MPRFASEFGIQSWCSMETLLPVSVPVDRDVDSDFVSHRQHHPQGRCRFNLDMMDFLTIKLFILLTA